MHLAYILKQTDGLPTYGNQPSSWKSGEKFGHENPEYR